MRVIVNLVDETAEIIFRPICKNCGAQLKATGHTKIPGRKYQDVSLECPGCGGMAEIREDRLQRVISLNKEFQVQMSIGVV